MIRVGIAGWSYPDWAGVVYPARGAGRVDRLALLAEYFSTIEINTTFYRIPDRAMTASWAARVQGRPDFRFTVKLFKGFTHRRPEPGGVDASSFRRALEPLAGAGLLGAILVQFPYSFHPSPASREIMGTLFESFRDYPLVVEVRHADWDKREFLEFLEARGVGFCNIDQPAVSRSLGPTEIATSRVGYVRLHGRNAENWFRKDASPSARYDYLYSEEELSPWVDRVRRIAEQAADVFVIANNHYRGKGPLGALTLLSMLTGRPVPVPPELAAAYPQIAPRAIIRKPAQKPLFRD